MKKLVLQSLVNKAAGLRACNFIKRDSNHSHDKRNDSLETWALYLEIFLVSWNLLHGPKHRGSIFKNMANSKKDHLLAGNVHTIIDKIDVDILCMGIVQTN